MKKQWLIFLIILISFLFPKQKINHYAPKRENNFTSQIIETVSSTEPTKEEIFTLPVEEKILIKIPNQYQIIIMVSYAYLKQK